MDSSDKDSVMPKYADSVIAAIIALIMCAAGIAIVFSPKIYKLIQVSRYQYVSK